MTSTDRPQADVLLVSHTHWDREWYRTFEAFRARLVDTVDRVLDLLDADPGWAFLLDGQAVVVEDYLAVRFRSRHRLVAAVAPGASASARGTSSPTRCCRRVESHVRNLLEGRRVAEPSAARPGWPTRPTRSATPPNSPSSSPASASAPSSTGGVTATRSTGWARLPVGGARAARPSLDYVLTRGYFTAAGLPADPGEAATPWPGSCRTPGSSPGPRSCS